MVQCPNHVLKYILKMLSCLLHILLPPQLVGQFLKWEFVEWSNWDPLRYPQELFVMEFPQNCGTLRTKTMRMSAWIDGIPKQHLKEQNLQATCFLFTKANSLRQTGLPGRESLWKTVCSSIQSPWSFLYQTTHISGVSGEFSNWWEFWCGEW